MKKKYEDLDIGELFKLGDATTDEVFMKISHEYDHNYFYVCYQGLRKGIVDGPLEDSFLITSTRLTF